MDYDKKLIEKAKRSICRICMEHPMQKQRNRNFMQLKPVVGLLCTYPMLEEWEGVKQK